MAWFATIGVAVAAYVGVTITSTFIATLIGGAIVGAAVGALYSAFTGGNILKGALYGALGGSVIAGGGYLAGEAFSGIGSGVNLANDTLAGTQTIGGGLFTASTSSSFITAAASLGSSFLKGGAEGSNLDKKIEADKATSLAQIASNEKIAAENRDAAIAQAEIAAGGANERQASAERIANAEREFLKDKFEKEFEETKFQDRKNREEKEQARLRSEQGITEGSAYVAGHTSTVSPLEVNKRRKALLSPDWYTPGTTTANTTSSTAEQGLTPGGTVAPTTPTPGNVGIVGA